LLFVKEKTRLIYSNGFIIILDYYKIIIASLERGKNDDDDVIDLKT